MSARPRLRLASVNAAPAIAVAPPKPKAPELKPLLSTKAREIEAAGKRFYETAPVNPKDLPSAYLTLTAYRPRVERRFWRMPIAIGIGALVGIAALGLNADLLTACAVGVLAGFGIWVSDGWVRS